MRTIKFRGKCSSRGENNGKWAYGYFLRDCNGVPFIHVSGYNANFSGFDIDYPIIYETLGQFTGLTDKNGREIYEGDIISTHLGACEVIHSDYGWAFCTREENKMNTRDKLYYHTFNAWSGYIECGFVIGNIHDNPELMKGGEV